MPEILVISFTNITQMVMGEIGSDLRQFHDWLIFNCPKELSRVKVPEKEILLLDIQPKKTPTRCMGRKILFGYDF